MAHLRIRGVGADATPPTTTHRHAVLIGVWAGRPSLTLPITEAESPHDNLAGEWEQIDRPGTFPLHRRKQDSLRTLQLTSWLITPKRPLGAPVEPQINALRFLANSGRGPVAVSWGPLEAGLWDIDDLRVVPVKRFQGSNAIELARAELHLTEHRKDESPKPPSARRSGGAPGSGSAPASSAAPSGGAKKATRSYTVKKGDTLSRIAASQCGNANLWPRIAEANRLRDPNLIKPGQQLVIPC